MCLLTIFLLIEFTLMVSILIEFFGITDDTFLFHEQ